MSKENSKEAQQNKKLQHYGDKVSKFIHQDNNKNINFNEEAKNKISINNKDRSKIKEKMPMDSIRKVTGKNAETSKIKDIKNNIRKEKVIFENQSIENKVNPQEDIMNQPSYERDQINLYSVLNDTRKDINIGDSDKEKSSEKNSIFTNGDFKIKNNNIDIGIFGESMKDIKKESSSNENHQNSSLLLGVDMVDKSNNKGNLIIESEINNIDNINNIARETYNHNKSVNINVEEIEKINNKSSIYNINNNNDDKNKNINNNIKRLKNEFLAPVRNSVGKGTINDINKNVINNINRNTINNTDKIRLNNINNKDIINLNNDNNLNNNLNNNIINEIDNNIASNSDNKFDILIKNIEKTNQINSNLASEISNLVTKIDESNTNIQSLNTNISALVEQNQTIINALIHGNSKSSNPNEISENKNHS